MKAKRTFILFVAIVGVLGLGAWLLVNQWARKATRLDTARIIESVQTYRQENAKAGKPMPASVSLRELISLGHLRPEDVSAFEGFEVDVVLQPDESKPRQVLLRAKARDGIEFVVLSDGSIQSR